MRESYFKYSLVLFFLIYSLNCFSQKSVNDILIDPRGDTIYVKSIALSEITSNIEISYEKIKKIDETLKTDVQLVDFDSVFGATKKDIDSSKIDLHTKNFISIYELDYEIKLWQAYSKKLELWKTIINEKLKQVENKTFEFNVLLSRWKLTIIQAKAGQVPANVLSSVNDLLKELKTTSEQLNDKQTELLRRQNKVTELRIVVDDEITYLNDTKKTIQSDYFRTDSYPLWRAADSTLNIVHLRTLISDSYRQNVRQLNNFYQKNRRAVVVHFFILLALWLGFYFLSLEAKKIIADESFPEMDRSQHVLSMHTLSAMIIALFISIWMYSSIPIILGNFLQFFYLIIGLFFLTSYIDVRLKKTLLILLVLFLLNEAQIFLFGRTLISRILILAENLITAWLLYLIVSPKFFISKLLQTRHWGVFLKLIPVFFVFVAVSFLGNFFGYVNLSLLLNKTVVYALLNLNLLLLVILVIQKSFSIIFRTALFQKSNIIRQKLEYIEKKFFQTIKVLGILLWLKSVLKTLGVYDELYTWFTEAAKTSWQLGNSTIAVGGILNFFLVIIFTFLIVRFLRTLLNEELYPRIILPRGVPGAISMIVGYIIIAYGFFIALGAAGVDLGQFGLIAGALGVGIGFGLQGIVANFIAGIVLAFERPIQVGDTIQIGTMMGEVTHIGVRASTIKTFDGSEVIVPNSSLIVNDVTNWTLSNRKRRWDIPVGVAYGTDPNKVLEIISNVANEHPDVQKTPAPWALFDGFGDSSLNFRIRIWTTVDTGMTTKSDVTVKIYEALQKAGIEIPFPQRDIYIKSLPKDKEDINKEHNKKTSSTKKPKITDK
jgi:potassium-dependent mechanosensitive channel